jgi:hypothetical protein
MWIILALIVGGGISLWLLAKNAANRSAMERRREPLERLQSDVISQMNFLDDQLSALDAGTAARVRETRVSAGTSLDEAVRLIRRARTDTDLARAEQLLNQAAGEIARGRAIITGAGGAATAGATSGGDGFTFAKQEEFDWSTVPDPEKGVCFFCSRPSMLRELTPVTVSLGGEQRKVLACAGDLRTIKSGEMPKIRAFQRGGQTVPWYAADDYDPYRDYDSRGYGGGSMLSDLVMMSAVNSMFWGWHNPVGWGWGGGYPYAFHTDHQHYRDHRAASAASNGDFQR